MAPKRKLDSCTHSGLAPGQSLRRNSPNENRNWSWMGPTVNCTSDITFEHCLRACGLSKQSQNPFCENKYESSVQGARNRNQSKTQRSRIAANGLAPVITVDSDVLTMEDKSEIIVIDADEDKASLHPCDKKLCRNNPNCLNYLVNPWESVKDGAGYISIHIEARSMVRIDVNRKYFCELLRLGRNPAADTRKAGVPVGLKVK